MEKLGKLFSDVWAKLIEVATQEVSNLIDEQLKMSGTDKRSSAFLAIRNRLVKLGLSESVSDSMINLAIETALANLKRK